MQVRRYARGMEARDVFRKRTVSNADDLNSEPQSTCGTEWRYGVVGGTSRR